MELINTRIQDVVRHERAGGKSQPNFAYAEPLNLVETSNYKKLGIRSIRCLGAWNSGAHSYQEVTAGSSIEKDTRPSASADS